MRRPPPRIYAQKRIEDIRASSVSTGNTLFECMNSIELIDFLAVHAGRINPPNIKREEGLIQSPVELLPSLLDRALRLLPQMDCVLVVRLFSYLQTANDVSVTQYQGLLDACVPRLSDLSIQQLVRLMFSVSVSSKRLALDTTAFSDSCFTHLNFDTLGESTPPRLVSKLVVSSAILTKPHQAALFLPKLETLVGNILTHLEPDQLQQVAFGLGRLGTENSDLVNRITMHALHTTPIRDKKTYSSLLISLHRLYATSPSWEAFKKVYIDYIGLSPSDPHISNLAECLPGESEILLRRIRNALVH